MRKRVGGVAVDEAVWLAAVVPRPMLDHLRGRLSERKQLLLVCACARRLWLLLPDPRGLELLEAAERYADGEISQDDLLRARFAASTWASCESGIDQLTYLRGALCRAPTGRPEVAWHRTWEATSFALNFSAFLVERDRVRFAKPGVVRGKAWDEEARAQADLLREIVGNPFRPCPPLPAAVLRWQDRLVPRLAQSTYDEQRWGQLPVLADALLDAGCEDDALLDHCRGDAEHVRGCWAVDALLGRS
jgi:hypothetical protein